MYEIIFTDNNNETQVVYTYNVKKSIAEHKDWRVEFIEYVD